MRVVAELLGYDKKFCWLRMPKRAFGRRVILTQPVDLLRHGFKSASLIEVRVDPDSLRAACCRDDWSGYQADLELISVIENVSAARATARTHPEGPGQKGQ